MTIAIGMMASNGIVIAADTQESTGGTLKGDKTKMMSFSAMQLGKPEAGSLAGSCVVSGAGDSGYVKALTEELGTVFLENPNLSLMRVMRNPRIKTLQKEFKKCLRTFYKENVIPFAAFPSRDRPDVEMLIAAYRKFGLQSSTFTL